MSGDRRVVTPGSAPAARVGRPVRTGWGPPAERFDDLVDVDAPTGTPGTLRRGPDGVIRAVPDPEPWGDEVRFRSGPPDPNDTTAPDGARHVDLTTGRTYRKRSTP